MTPEEWTDEDIEAISNEAADAIVYRLNWYVVNSSADFSARVNQQYAYYCNHLVAPQEGMNALLQTFYLTHAFEHETADDIKAVCNQMLLRKGELDREEGQCDHRPAAGLPADTFCRPA